MLLAISPSIGALRRSLEQLVQLRLVVLERILHGFDVFRAEPLFESEDLVQLLEGCSDLSRTGQPV